MIPDWFEPSLTLFPFAAWMFLGVGLPWALALLPRSLWREKLTVLAVSMALGPLITTTVMFVLGTVGTLTLTGTLIGSALAAGAPGIFAWRAWRNGPSPTEAIFTYLKQDTAPSMHVARTEALLIAGIVLLLLLNVVATAYWPFLSYDPLWVYAYNAKIFVMERAIPDSMGYYPQLVPLSYTYLQQAWGGVNDHAARVVIPWLNVAMVLMAYELGVRVFRSRRVGLLTAAIWTFYPHVAAWNGSGDLEIPLTLYVTGASAFFVEAWRTERARFAVLSGLLLAGALWTKPTGGALAIGIALAVGVWAVRVRFVPRAIWPKLRLAIIAGLACAPIGGMWYVRNLILGHTAVVFPAGYWHSFAQRSGQEFGWPLLIAALAVGALLAHPPDLLRARSRWLRVALPLLALALLLAGTLPTALNTDLIGHGDNGWRWLRGDLTAGGRLSVLESLLIAAGFALLAWIGWGIWRRWPAGYRETSWLVWALLLPYGVVWFFDFSYHYRLSFAIVPLFAVQVAVLIDGWLWPWLAGRPWIGRAAGALVIGAWGVAMAVGVQHNLDYWFGDKKLADDRAKYDAGNASLMVVVHMLEDYAAQHGEPPVVAIPGEDRLPFFFPSWDIRNSREPDELPTTLDDLDEADLFINGSVPRFLWQDAGLYPNPLDDLSNVAAAYHYLAVPESDGSRWPTPLQPIPLNADGSLAVDDGNFRFEAYEIHPEARTATMKPIVPAEGEVIVGDFAQYVGHNIVSGTWYRGDKTFLTLYWRPTDTAPPQRDYSIYIHLLDADGSRVAGWDGQPLQGEYPTRDWQPGESLLDYWVLQIPPDTPAGTFDLRVGIYDSLTGERLPVTVDGDPADDGLTIDTITVE
ncbi:ArnT family glycosyltransferase [Aggregatilinea lenta]|uniref:ArnT family glycosyltransferase n=1 Tax=Aggregatilinea lenta TaxID=913108 RepID=UPI000E5B7E71|nr:glycosyltransferase family 39 protein [Aggregatilinea lenta]